MVYQLISENGTTWEFRDKRFGVDDHKKIINFIGRNLPVSILKKIPWGDWKDLKSRSNARMRFHTIFEKYAFDQIANYNLFELFQNLESLSPTSPRCPNRVEQRSKIIASP